MFGGIGWALIKKKKIKMNKLTINFKTIDFDSFTNDDYNFNLINEIEINFEHYDINKHKLEFDKLVKFKNIKVLKLISYYDLTIDAFDLSPLINLKLLEKVYLIGDSLRPFGLVDLENNKYNFEVIVEGMPSLYRIMSIEDDNKKLLFFGGEINYFDKIDFNKFFVDYFSTSQQKYEGLSLQEIENFNEIVLDSFTPIDQIRRNGTIDLSPFSICTNIRKFRINIDYPTIEDEENKNQYFALDTIPEFENLELLEIQGFTKNYNFIKKFKKLREFIVHRNFLGEEFLSSNFNQPLTSIKKISLRYVTSKLLSNFSLSSDFFPNLEELTIEGMEMEDYKINPLEIIVFKNLKKIYLPHSNFLDFGSDIISSLNISEKTYNQALEWCLKKHSK